MDYKNWYLVRLFRQNKILFIFVLLFIFFQLYFNQKRIHSFPWFVWDMYSREESMPDTVTQTEVFIDGKRLDVTHIPIWQEATILHTYKMYNWQKMNGDNDPINDEVKKRTRYFPERVYHFVAYKINNHPEESQQYPAWLKNYLEKRLHQKINHVELKDVQYKYEGGKFRQVNAWTVLKIDN
ncbi:MAG: hypothetical protein JWN78_353 [Bacteroidota bacterium]|nr:hypothetical protein [Bacteroidota bacterium]